MLFSDNVSLEDEIALKALSRRKGLLVMGPDCGTAIINGMPLCFANVVKRGPVGVIGASGTGIQEVTCLIDRAGSGVSQAIGAGGRDLKNERVGGATTLMGIEALAGDDDTKVIVIISKPPAKSVADAGRRGARARRQACRRVLRRRDARGAPRRLGRAFRRQPRGDRRDGRRAGQGRALRAARSSPRPRPRSRRSLRAKRAASRRRSVTCADISPAARSPTRPGSSRIARPAPFIPTTRRIPRFVLADPRRSVGHTVVDLGDDAFTVGRPHPMIDPSTRVERMMAERDDGEIAVVVVDVVIGYGSHEDPAGAIAPAIEAMRAAARRARRLSAGSRLDHRDGRRPAELRVAEGEARGGGLRRHALEPSGLRVGDQDCRENRRRGGKAGAR